MPLTAERGAQIRSDHAGRRERLICERHGLTQIGGSQTKVDGQDEFRRVSIKNASGSSTQVHITSQQRFINYLGLTGHSEEFIRLFCGNKDLDVNGKDRYTPAQLSVEMVECFVHMMNENRDAIVDLIVSNGFGITDVIFNDIKNDREYTITMHEIRAIIQECSWVVLRGGVHLKRPDGTTVFHLQREGKRNPRNRYNVLFHIHRNLFV